MDEGFIDLRRGFDAGAGGDTFWPSFTDVMMVVLMIFMIASTILMLRNSDLVRELRATIESERAAEELAQSASRTSATLEERLAQAQSELSELRIRLLRAGEEKRDTDKLLAAARQQALALRNSNDDMANRLQQLHSDYTRLDTAHSALQLSEAELRRIEQERAKELAELRQQYSDAELRLSSLQGEYDDLSVRYDKLVKPARTATGKHVVSVRYRKDGNSYKLEYKATEEGEYNILTRKQLDERLDRLKQKYPDKLYVKVVIPEDSGLSYNEAWTFTQDILTSYDYYYQ